MTTVVDGQAVSLREQHRTDMAALIHHDISAMEDSARLVEDLGLDSMAMVLLLSLLERSGGHGVSIRLTGTAAPLADPAEVIVPAQAPPPVRGSLAPVLSNRSFRLEPIGVDDINFLYTLAVDPATSFRWRYRGAPPSVDQFVKELWDQVLVQFVVRRIKDNAPIGHLVCYAPGPARRYAYVGAVFLPEYLGSGIGARVVIMFIRYLFHTFSFVKLYMEIPGFNWPLVSSGAGRLFHVEGVLHGHDCYAGRAWDQYLCAIYPDAEQAARRYAPP